jgi:hypothetical protein
MSTFSLEDLAAQSLVRALAAQLDAQIFINHTKNSDGSDIIEKSGCVCGVKINFPEIFLL